MDLPYVEDACVLGIPYHEARQLCGVVIKLRPTSPPSLSPSSPQPAVIALSKIRSDLSNAGVLPAYMFPVVLRILKESENIPLTHSGKPIKRQILSQYFLTTDSFPAENLPEGVEYCGCGVPNANDMQGGTGTGTSRPWDWGGMQRASDA